MKNAKEDRRLNFHVVRVPPPPATIQSVEGKSQVQAGDRVQNSSLGAGLVIAIYEDGTAQVDFDRFPSVLFYCSVR